MPIDCADASSNFPLADSWEDLKPVFSTNPWPCPGYATDWDIAPITQPTAGSWTVEFDLGVGALFGNPFTYPGVPAGALPFEFHNGFKASLYVDAYFGLNPGATVTMVVTATEVGGAGRVYQNSLDVSDAP